LSYVDGLGTPAGSGTPFAPIVPIPAGVGFRAYALVNRLGRIYVGQTGCLSHRIIVHNGGGCRSTRAGRPWRLLFSVGCSDREEAVKMERCLRWSFYLDGRHRCFDTKVQRVVSTRECLNYGDGLPCVQVMVNGEVVRSFRGRPWGVHNETMVRCDGCIARHRA